MEQQILLITYKCKKKKILRHKTVQDFLIEFGMNVAKKKKENSNK